jgi:signal transduction histidine kinase
MTDELSSTAVTPSRPMARVLVVDDHAAFAENVVDILSSAAHDVVLRCSAVRSALQALAAATSESFELALIDLHLPDAHGLDLAQQLKAICPYIQIVIITGDATIESAIGALDQGAFGYVLKPFRPQQLVETALRAVERARLLREREQLRTELERSERRNRDVIDGVPAFVTALDQAGRIVVWNSQLEKVSGFTRQEMLGTKGDSLVANGGTLRLPLKGGGHRSVRWTLAKIPESQDGPAVTYALGVDVTEESEMLQRTLRAERLAAVGTLATGLAHEVRNPLNSATLQLQLLERKLAKGTVDVDGVSAIAHIVRDELERLERLVKDFLSFAKPQVLEPKPGNLNGVVDLVLALLDVEIKKAHVHVERRLDSNLGLVPIEEQSFKQVLLNLMRNSIEAMHASREGKLTVVTQPVPDAAAVELCVVDNGPGFDATAPVFDAFYTTKEGGTGLGLAIVHRIVTEHGGTVNVVSKPGHTCFSIRLPQPAAAAPTSG